ncbi:hypothetical protein Tco_0539403 [Tanacetum coccineum]
MFIIKHKEKKKEESTASSSVSTASSSENTASLMAIGITEYESKKYYRDWEKKYEDTLMEVILLDMTSPRPRNQDSSRRTVNVEDASSKAMVAINGAVFDWSFMAEEEVTRNMVLMAFSDSEISKSLMEDMLPLVEESEEERSLVKMCNKKNWVLFTDTACFVLSPDFKLPDESQILLKIPIKNNMYSVDMKNIVPKDF